MEMRSGEKIVLRNDYSEKLFRRWKIWRYIAGAVFSFVLLFMIVQAIRSGDIGMLAAAIFGILVFLLVFTVLSRFYGHIVYTITFEGQNAVFELCNKEKILISRYAIKEVEANWARIVFAYQGENGGRKTLWMARRKWVLGGPLVDEDTLKRELVGTAFYGM